MQQRRAEHAPAPDGIAAGEDTVPITPVMVHLPMRLKACSEAAVMRSGGQVPVATMTPMRHKRHKPANKMPICTMQIAVALSGWSVAGMDLTYVFDHPMEGMRVKYVDTFTSGVLTKFPSGLVQNNRSSFPSGYGALDEQPGELHPAHDDIERRAKLSSEFSSRHWPPTAHS